jgi:hypothetical protein
MKWWLAVLAPLAVDATACMMPAWLKDSGPVIPHETFTGINGSENQRPAARRLPDAGPDAH